MTGARRCRKLLDQGHLPLKQSYWSYIVETRLALDQDGFARKERTLERLLPYRSGLLPSSSLCLVNNL